MRWRALFVLALVPLLFTGFRDVATALILSAILFSAWHAHDARRGGTPVSSNSHKSLTRRDQP